MRSSASHPSTPRAALATPKAASTRRNTPPPQHGGCVRSASSTSSAVSSSSTRSWLSSERVLLSLVLSLTLLTLYSLLLSSVRLRCDALLRSRSSRTRSTSPDSPSMRLGYRDNFFRGAWQPTHKREQHQEHYQDQEQHQEQDQDHDTRLFYGDTDRRAFHHQPPPTYSTTKDCSPHTLNATTIQYASHKFYTTLQSRQPLFPPVVLKRKHHYQCDPHGREKLTREWSYCLPITGRHDLPYCAAPDRMYLLVPQTPETLCYSSVLHMLLVDVYQELLTHGAQPALLFGSLLGAVRNASLIAYTEDVDIGYVYSSSLRMADVRQALWRKGYHLFREGVLRVCVAPTHPLASNLYDPRRDSERRAYHVPYVDLYKMQLAATRDAWQIEEIRKKRRVPAEKVQPFTQVRVNDLLFDTLADPVHFLVHEYGIRWQTPLKRGTYRVVEEGEQDNLPEAAMPRVPLAYDMGDGEYDSAVDYEMPEIGDANGGQEEHEKEEHEKEEEEEREGEEHEKEEEEEEEENGFDGAAGDEEVFR